MPTQQVLLVRTFRRTIPTPAFIKDSDVVSSEDTIDADVNAFLTTLDPLKVRSVQKVITPLGYNGEYTLISVTVLYLNG